MEDRPKQETNMDHKLPSQATNGQRRHSQIPISCLEAKQFNEIDTRCPTVCMLSYLLLVDLENVHFWFFGKDDWSQGINTG